MKIKVDYVTNSSSEVFGVVLLDSAVTAGLLLMLDTVTTGFTTVGPHQKQEKLADELMMESEKIAARVTEGVLEDARNQEKIVKEAYGEAYAILNKAAGALQEEMAQTKKNWETIDKTPNKTSSEYSLLKSKNDNYLNYLTTQVKQIAAQKKVIEKDRQEKNEFINGRDAWIQQNQADYVTLMEQKALLESLRGIVKETDATQDPWQASIEELSRRQVDLDQALAEANARCDYKAIERSEIKLNLETTDLLRQLDQEKENYERQALNANASTKAKLLADFTNKSAKIRDNILKANRIDMVTKASEGIQYGADVAIAGLAELAGPGGAQIKIAYSAIKTMITGVKDAHKDPKNKSKHLAKAILAISANALKDQLSDQPWAKDATILLNATLQGSLSASIAGTSIPESIGSSLTKGIFDLGAGKGIAALKVTTVSQNEIKSDFDLLSPQEILNDNPLTQKLSDAFKTQITFVQ